MILGQKQVDYTGGSYPILLAEDFQGLRAELDKISKISSVIIITERSIGQMYLKYVENELSGLSVPVQIIYTKGSEKNKHIDRVKKVYHAFIDGNADRKALVLALGGGVVGDFAGFIAATYQRGVRFVQIPTTLLASVDSSVGGKVAVNLDKGKNMVGSFHQPEFVFIPSFVMATLSEKDWRCGLAEILKHSLLNGGEMWSDFRSHNRSDILTDSPILRKMILDSVAFKASVVAQDEKEGGLRQILNLGHTTAHAIESLTKYKKYSHGEAVSIGLITALLLSRKVGFSDDQIREIAEVMRGYGLPVFDSSKAGDIVSHMEHDKKKVGNDLKFVLLEEIGKPLYGISVSRKEIIDTWKEQRSAYENF